MRRSLAVLVLLAIGGAAYAAYLADERVRAWVVSVTRSAPPAALAKAKSMPPAPVRLAEAGRRDVPIRLEGLGNVQARSTVAIKARVDGQLMEATVSEGQMVKKGDLLFRLDARPFEAQVRQAEANVARDRANLDKAKGDMSRYDSLAQKGISPKTKLEEVEALVATFAAAIRASEAAVEIARLNLEYATIKAPIEGRVGSILLAAGNMVKANDTQALLVIAEVAPVHVAFAVPERYLGDVRRLIAAGKVAVEGRQHFFVLHHNRSDQGIWNCIG